MANLCQKLGNWGSANSRFLTSVTIYGFDAFTGVGLANGHLVVSILVYADYGYCLSCPFMLLSHCLEDS